MTAEKPPSEAPAHDIVAAIVRELEKAGVEHVDVFARREEIVIVLPGRGGQAEQARQAAQAIDLRGRHYVTVMAEDGLPGAMKLVLGVLVFAIAVFGAVLMLWGYLGASLRGDDSPDSPAQNEAEAR